MDALGRRWAAWDSDEKEGALGLGAPAAGDRSRSLSRTAVIGLAASTAVVLGGLMGGSTYETHLPGAWFFGMPGGHLGWIGANSLVPPISAAIAVYAGLIVLSRVWIGLLRELRRHPGTPVTRIVAVVSAWAVPFIVSPPLFSRDVYSYAGQGEMVSHHINPSLYGTGVLGSTPFSMFPDVVWTNTPSPYGQSFLSIDGLLDDISAHGMLLDLVLLRLLEVAALGLALWAIPHLARRAGKDPAGTVLLAGSPLVLVTLVSGAHNDALMAGLLLAGLAVAFRVGMVPGIVVCALATGVKSPAALGVVFLGWMWAGRDAPLGRRLAHAAAAGAIALGTLEVVSLISGLGWGWISNSGAADKSFTLVTPVDAVSRLAADLLVHVHPGATALGVRTVLSVVGLGCAGGLCLWLLVRSTGHDLVRNLGLSLLLVAALGPILWSWYVTWGVLVLAPVAGPRLRTLLVALCTFELFTGVATLHSVYATLVSAGVVESLLLAAVLVAALLVPLPQFSRRRVAPRELGRGSDDAAPEATLAGVAP